MDEFLKSENNKSNNYTLLSPLYSKCNTYNFLVSIHVQYFNPPFLRTSFLDDEY